MIFQIVAERRSLFLSKVQAPPSPTAACLPKTPPESPAVFHYSLPSPGLVSPLSVFGRVGDESPRENWVEEVNFHLPKQHTEPGHTHTSALPSLEQITARLNAQGHGIHSPSIITHAKPRRSILPAFLQARKSNSTSPPATDSVPAPAEDVTTTSGRLRLPIRKKAAPVAPSADAAALHMAAPQPRVFLPPISPVSPKLQVTTTVINSPPRSSSPSELTEHNLAILNSREITTNNMLSAVRRRVAITDRAASVHGFEDNEVERVKFAEGIKTKRFSAPPELPRRERSGFTHPVLNMAGGF